MKIACCLILLSTAAAAQTVAKPPNLQDIMAARNYGMAGAYRALGYGAEAINGNPAALSLFKRYTLELSGAYDIQNTWGYGGISISDSITNEIAAGVNYQMATLGTGDSRRIAYLTTAASAYPLSQSFHIGMAIRHQVITGEGSTNSMTMSAGLIFRPWEALCLSVSGHNLIGVWSQDVPRYFSFGISSLLGGQFTPTVELRADFNQPAQARVAFSGGMEWLIADTFPVRVGYSYDQMAGTQHVGFGLGYFTEGSGIDLSYRHEINGTQGKLLALTIKIQFN
ncbi:MAG: hypothetical protein H6Q89_2288 [Myxococcaceae bacterium]|nr:hypothetical protein [Myxococcaceae bacterium]